jgi:hypothetical protein
VPLAERRAARAAIAPAALVALALLAPGCGGAPPSPGFPGVRERIVSTVPLAHPTALPPQVPRPGALRLGLAAGAAPTARAVEPRVLDGQRRTPWLDGELYVGVGMPGPPDTGDKRAGWELVGGATAAPTTGERAHDLDPMLPAPDQGTYGGYLQVNGAVSTPRTIFGAAFAVRAVQIPFVWDYGGCAGGPDCPIWNPKGAPASGEDLAWSVGGSMGFWARTTPRTGVHFAAGFEAPPSIPTSREGEVQCDGNGNCTGGRTPSTPRAETGRLHGQVVLGAEYRPAPWTRAFLLLAYSKEVDSGDGRLQVRFGLEATIERALRRR